MNGVIFDIKGSKNLSLKFFSAFLYENVFKLVLSSEILIFESIRVPRAAQSKLFGAVSQRCL